tara:strand:- start:35 stop:343 length:309 start_codon:yes stop_codon:yes gene_type:complete
MNKIKNDLGSLLLAELLVQASSNSVFNHHRVAADTQCLAEELGAIDTLVIAGELSEEQAGLHKQLRLNALKMKLLAIEGVDDIALERALDGMGRVMRQFYGN